MDSVFTYSFHRKVSNLIVTRWSYKYLPVLVLVILVIGAAGIRFLTFERFLPYMDYHDESFIYILARDWRGVELNSFIAERLSGYPPLYIWLHGAIQSVFESFTQRPWYTPPDYIYILRIVAVIVGVGTTLFVAAIGWQIGGSVAGIFAGMVWAFAPIIVDNNSLAIADPFGYFACSAAVAMVIRAWKTESVLWLFGCLLAGIASLYIKYWTLYPFFMWAIVALYLSWKQGHKIVIQLGLQVVVTAVAAAGLLKYIDDAGLSRLSPEMTTFSDQGFSNIFDIHRNLNNLSYFPFAIGDLLFWTVVVLGIGAVLYSLYRGWEVVKWQFVVLLCLTAIVAVIPTSTFIYISSIKYIRHALPVTILLIGVWGAAIAQIVWVANNLARQYTKFSYLPFGVTIALLGVVLIPYTKDNLEALHNFEQTQIQQVAWQWADINLPLEGLILMDHSSLAEDTWNRPWSGYDGSKSFEWWLEDSEVLIRPPEQYVERGMMYFVTSEGDRDRIYHPKQISIDSFLDQLVLIKTISASPNTVGESISFYRLMPPQVIVNIDFGGEIKLVGYDAPETTFKPGGQLQFRPYWRVDKAPSTNYSVFAHLYPEDEDRLLVQYDGPPTVTNRPTLTWYDVNELYIGDMITIDLPIDLPSGNYRLAIGLYDYSNGTRLVGSNGSSYFSIPISVTS